MRRVVWLNEKKMTRYYASNMPAIFAEKKISKTDDIRSQNEDIAIKNTTDRFAECDDHNLCLVTLLYEA